jgi:DNA replication regulator DPB11
MYSTASPSAQVKFRTECWLEWCFFEKRIVDEREHPLFIPIAIECPLPGERAKALRISFSGLGGDDALWAGRACHALGECIPLHDEGNND